METLFKQINVGTRGEFVYHPIKLAQSDSGKVFLEVHKDIYNKTNLTKTAKQLISRKHLADRVDWEKVSQAIKEKKGLPQDITKIN